MTLKIITLGEFSLHGKAQLVYANITMKYIKENELSKSRLPGNLLNVKADLVIHLSDYGITHSLIGKRIGEEVKISAALIGSLIEYKD